MFTHHECIHVGLQVTSGSIGIFLVSLFLPGELGLALRYAAGISLITGLVFLVIGALIQIRR